MGKIRELVSGSSGKGDTDEVLDNLEREELRRLKLARVRYYRLEDEKKLKDLERELKEEEKKGSSAQAQQGTVISPMDIESAKALAALPENQRTAVLAMVQAMKAAPSGDTSNMMIPLLLMQMQQAKSPEDASTIAIKTLAAVQELMNASGQGAKLDIGGIITGIANIMKVQKGETNTKFDEAIGTLVNRALDRIDAPPPKSFLEEILEDPGKAATVQRLFGAGDNLDALKLQKEIENDRRKWELAMKKFDLETKIRLLELQGNSQRRQQIESGFKRLIGAVSEALGEEGAIAPSQPKSFTPAASATKGSEKAATPELKQIQCDKCGAMIDYIDESAKTLICPSCGTKYEREQ